MPVQLMRILAGCACLISTCWAELNWNQQRLAQVRLTANGSTDINAMLKNKLLTFTGRRGSTLQCQAKAGQQHACIESTIHGLNGDRLTLRIGPNAHLVKALEGAEFVTVKHCTARQAARVGLGWSIDCTATDETQVDAIAAEDVFAIDSDASKSVEWTTFVKNFNRVQVANFRSRQRAANCAVKGPSGSSQNVAPSARSITCSTIAAGLSLKPVVYTSRFS